MNNIYKKIIYFAFSAALVLPFFAYAQSINTGIIDGIWFSEDHYLVGDTIRIYTAVQNNSGSDVKGEVHFFDNGQPVSIKNFNALDDRISEVWADVPALEEGTHVFSVSVENVVRGDGADVLVPSKKVSRGSVIVFSDTDGDGIHNEDDKDDDNDGFSDLIEKRLGTDPQDDTSVPVQKENISEERVTINRIDLQKEDLSGPVPNTVIETVEELPLLTPLVASVNGIQNYVLAEVQKQQDLGETDVNKKAWYSPVLPILHWIFSCFWCASILLLSAIYLVIKLIFKIIKRF